MEDELRERGDLQYLNLPMGNLLPSIVDIHAFDDPISPFIVDGLDPFIIFCMIKLWKTMQVHYI